MILSVTGEPARVPARGFRPSQVRKPPRCGLRFMERAVRSESWGAGCAGEASDETAMLPRVDGGEHGILGEAPGQLEPTRGLREDSSRIWTIRSSLPILGMTSLPNRAQRWHFESGGCAPP